ncbi:MAG TPA: hypothetical protein VFO84_08575, partial [Dehalococcoidia bacterium]|nr:hypothetical protein [Dehalococcoidia bacterium]
MSALRRLTDGILAGRRRYLGLRQSEWAMAGTSLALNAILNLLQTNRGLIPASFAASGAASGLAMSLGADAVDQGLEPRDVRRGTIYGLAVAAPIAAGVAAGLALGATRGLYTGGRMANADRAQAAYEVFLRIPLGTALPE